jgi:calcium-dependent protein kinase
MVVIEGADLDIDDIRRMTQVCIDDISGQKSEDTIPRKKSEDTIPRYKSNDTIGSAGSSCVSPKQVISGNAISQIFVETVAQKAGELSLCVRYHKNTKVEDDYEITTSALGTGLNGVVKLGLSKTVKSQRVAVKAFKFSALFGEKRSQLERELAVFLCMDHPHVSHLFDVYESPECLHLVMECLEGGELFHRLKKLGRFSEQDAADAAWQMLLALNYIHSRGVVHGDIKLENFMYDQQESNHLKLIDFGFSKISQLSGEGKSGFIGTLGYTAPELFEDKFSSQCDMWSLGVIVFSLLTGDMPFGGPEKEQIEAIKKGRFVCKPEKWKSVSTEALEFTQAMLQVDPNLRLTAQQALDHTWIVNRHQKRSIVIDDDIVKGLVDFGEASKFRRCCFTTMAWSLTNADRAKVRQYFTAMDTTQQGTITLAELTDVMNKWFHSDEKTRAVLSALDSNGDQEIHYSDFLAAMMSTRIDLNDDLLAMAFKRFDVDNSGFITVDNLQEVLGAEFQGVNVQELMNEADFVKDGRISKPEFAAYIKGVALDAQQQEAYVAELEKIIDEMISHATDDSRSRYAAKCGVTNNVPKPQQSQQRKCCALM